jgi:hypothetical protein
MVVTPAVALQVVDRLGLSCNAITEGIVLAIGAAAAGLAIGWFGLRALGTLNLQDLPRGADIRFDATTVTVTLAAGMVIGVLLGLFPTLTAVSWRASQIDPLVALAD